MSKKTYDKEWEYEFDKASTLTAAEARKVKHWHSVCDMNRHPGELCGCEVAAMLNKIKIFVEKTRDEAASQAYWEDRDK